MPGRRPPVVVQLVAWLLAILGILAVLFGLLIGTVVIEEWDNTYARGAAFLPLAIIAIGVGMVIFGKWIDRPRQDVSDAGSRGFEVKIARRDDAQS